MLKVQTQSMLLNRERLQILRELALVDNATETLYDQLTRFVGQVTHFDMSMLMMVASDHVFFKSTYGMPKEIGHRSSNISSSIAKEVLSSRSNVQIKELLLSETYKNEGTFYAMGVTSMSAVPLFLDDTFIIGILALFSITPRTATPQEMKILQLVGEIAMMDIRLRAGVRAKLAPQSQAEEGRRNITRWIAHLQETPQESSEIIQHLEEFKKQFALP
jgi:hypothetical protein